LVTYLLADLFPQSDAAALQSSADIERESEVQRLDELSEEDAEELLLQRLDAIGQ